MTDHRMNDELDAYIALLTEEKIAQGMAPEAARRAALLEAGGVEQVKESIRDVSPRTLLRSASPGCPLRPADDARARRRSTWPSW